MKTTILGLLLLLSLTGCVSGPRPTATDMALADTAVTHLVIESGQGYELNPLGFPATIVIKSIVLKNISTIKKCKERMFWDRAMSAIWGGATVNNMVVLIGAWTPVIGMTTFIATTATIWNYRLDKDQLYCDTAP